MKRFLHIWIFLLSYWLMAGSAMAQTYDKGLEAFEQGEYSKAYKALGKAEKKAKGKSNKAKIVALKAASALKMGKAGKAKKLFSAALKLDPEVELDSLVSKDKKVKKMFAAAKSDSGDSEEEEDEDDEGGKSGKSKSGKNKKSVSGITYILPFGINQYVQGKTIPAVIFGAAQAGGVGIFFYFKSEADKADILAQEAINGAEASNQKDNVEFKKYLDENEVFVKASRQQSTLGLALFGVSYAVSVLDAAFGFFGSKGGSSALLSPEGDAGSIAELSTTLEARPEVDWSYDLMLMPTQTPTRSPYPLIGLSIEAKF